MRSFNLLFVVIYILKFCFVASTLGSTASESVLCSDCRKYCSASKPVSHILRFLQENQISKNVTDPYECGNEIVLNENQQMFIDIYADVPVKRIACVSRDDRHFDIVDNFKKQPNVFRFFINIAGKKFYETDWDCIFLTKKSDTQHLEKGRPLICRNSKNEEFERRDCNMKIKVSHRPLISVNEQDDTSKNTKNVDDSEPDDKNKNIIKPITSRNSIILYASIGGGILFVAILALAVWKLLKNSKKSKDKNYKELSSFPEAKLEEIYLKPVDTVQNTHPGKITQGSKNAIKVPDDEIYDKLEDMYSKPVSKETADLSTLYAKVQPKNERNKIENHLIYSDLQMEPRKETSVNETNEPNYAAILKKEEKRTIKKEREDYTNVFIDGP